MAWQKGCSGNPAGRPRGRGEVAELRALIKPHLPELLQRVMLQALAGDTTAQRLILDRVLPVLKPEQLPASLPELDIDSPLVQGGQQVLRAVADGALSPDTGSQFMGLLAALAGLKTVDELEARIRALEGNSTDGNFSDLA